VVENYYISYIKHIIYILLFLITLPVHSKNDSLENIPLIDSLHKELEQSTYDTTKSKLLYEIAVNTVNKVKNYNEEEVIVMLEKAMTHAKKSKNAPLIRKSSSKLLRAYAYFNKDSLATYFSKQALQYFQNLNDTSGIMAILHANGNRYYTNDSYHLAFDAYMNYTKFAEELNDSSALSTGYVGLANVYTGIRNYKEGIKYHKKALLLKTKLNNQFGMSVCYINLGVSFNGIKEPDSSIFYLKRALDIQLTTGNIGGTVWSHNGIGSAYLIKKNYNEALKHFLLAYDVIQQRNIRPELPVTLCGIAQSYLDLKNYEKAMGFANQALKVGKKEGQLEIIKTSYEIKSEIYKEKMQFKKSLEMFEKANVYKDSIVNAGVVSNINKTYNQYIQGKIKSEARLKLLIEEERSKVKSDRQKFIIIIIVFISALLGFFLFFIMNRLKLTRKQKAVIEEQKEVVEEAHQEIKDSIAYAKRIQSAILPPTKLVKEYLKESFILYKPKDVVAGDFYWMEHKDNKVLFAAADCTGHGVPGAMVSVVCNNALNRSVREHGLTEPGEILTKTREIVIQEFEKSEEDVKDGMDIALCSLEGMKLQYAGAHNPLWIIRKGEIIETKANKQPIGQFDNPEPYTTHSFDLEKGDSLYMFSDGYVDQFGGEKGKKFKARAFRELLLSIQDKSMEEQKTIIDESFEAWRGSLEQIDDVCVIGVRV